jgi:hypothetical protein
MAALGKVASIPKQISRVLIYIENGRRLILNHMAVVNVYIYKSSALFIPISAILPRAYLMTANIKLLLQSVFLVINYARRPV